MAPDHNHPTSSRYAAGAPTGSRRRLLPRAAVGAFGLIAASALFAGDGAPATAVGDPMHRDSVDEWGAFASTTEALTVTLLTELLRRASQNEVPSAVATIFDGVYAAELDHWNFISQTFRPITERFWIPDGFFGGPDDSLDLEAVGRGVAAGEHLFVSTYLLGVTVFASAGEPRFARYAAELAGVESEHRVLGQYLAGESPPNDLGFEVFAFSTVGEIAAAAASAGFGFGSEGSAPGRFYELPSSPMQPPVSISGNEPS